MIVADNLENSKVVQKQTKASVDRAFDWLAENYSIRRNPSAGHAHNYGYLFLFSQAARISNRRLIGQHDWYQEGAEMLIRIQDSLQGFWRGPGTGEENRLIATSFALLFLAGQQPAKETQDND